MLASFNGDVNIGFPYPRETRCRFSVILHSIVLEDGIAAGMTIASAMRTPSCPARWFCSQSGNGCAARRVVARDSGFEARPVVARHRDDAFENSDPRRGQPKYQADPTVVGEEAGIGQLAEMGARRLRRHPRGIGQLGCAHRLTVEQRRQDICSLIARARAAISAIIAPLIM